ncbi:MAG: hypothetical protein JSV65_00950, partial [Armatimonadota bacterium]
MRTHLQTAAAVGMVVGIIVGVSEAVAAAGAHGRVLRAADFWGLWGVTVGVYAALGWVAFGVLGAVVGAAAALLRRAGADQDRFLYHILGAIALPPALVLGRADLDIAPEAMTFLLLRVGAWSVAAGAVMWVAL